MLSPGTLTPMARARASWLVAVLAGLAAAAVVMVPDLPDRMTASLVVAWVAGFVATAAASWAGYAIFAATMALALVAVGVYLRGPDAVFDGLLAFGIVVVLILGAHGGLVGVVVSRATRLGGRALRDGRVLAGAAVALVTGVAMWWLMTELARNPA